MIVKKINGENKMKKNSNVKKMLAIAVVTLFLLTITASVISADTIAPKPPKKKRVRFTGGQVYIDIDGDGHADIWINHLGEVFIRDYPDPWRKICEVTPPGPNTKVGETDGGIIWVDCDNDGNNEIIVDKDGTVEIDTDDDGDPDIRIDPDGTIYIILPNGTEMTLEEYLQMILEWIIIYL